MLVGNRDYEFMTDNDTIIIYNKSVKRYDMDKENQLVHYY